MVFQRHLAICLLHVVGGRLPLEAQHCIGIDGWRTICLEISVLVFGLILVIVNERLRVHFLFVSLSRWLLLTRRHAVQL